MVFGIPGTENILGDFDISGILSGVGKLALLIFVFLFVGGVMFFIFWTLKQKKIYNKKIFWFEEVYGDMIPIGQDIAQELTIPGTNIQTFYIKRKDLYLPRLTKRMGKDNYWIAIKNNRELVNFTMKNINKEMTESNLDFDHTDMRYALTNLKDLIKRNYRDKSEKWWQAYKEVISLVILIFVLSVSFFFLFTKMGDLVDKIGVLIEHADHVIKSVEAVRGSGVIVK